MKALNLPSWKNVFWFAKDLLRIKSEKDSLNLEWREKKQKQEEPDRLRVLPVEIRAYLFGRITSKEIHGQF